MLDGRDLAAVPTHQRGIGLMFQDYALFPHRDVAANVAFGLRMRGDPPAARRRRVAEVLALVGLAGFGDRSVATLSGGERQRVALARALAPSPGAAHARRAARARSTARCATGWCWSCPSCSPSSSIGVVYVTHDQAEALALADRVVVMDAGSGRAGGSARAGVGRRRPTAFVARFLGLTNVFATVIGDRLGRPAVGLGGRTRGGGWFGHGAHPSRGRPGG